MGTVFFGAKSISGRGDEVLDGERYAQFFQSMLDRGIYLPPAQNEAWFLSSSHSNTEIQYVSSCIIDFLSAHPAIV